jgi:hypothetical protein
MGAKKYLVDAKPFLPDGTDQFSQDDLIDIYDRAQKKWLQIPVSLLTPQLKADLYSTKNVGGITVGETLSAGTKLEQIFQQMLTVEEPPTYLAPTVSLSSNYAHNQKVEAGTVLSIDITAAYHQRDGGPATAASFYKDGIEVGSDAAAPFSLSGIGHNLTDSNVQLQAQVDYLEGPVKNTNLGNPSPAGQIPAGTVSSNIIRISGVRKLFFGVSMPVSSSAEIRALTNAVLGPAINTQFTINIPAGAISVAFAYPAQLPAVSSVKYVEGLNAEVKDVFSQSTVNVEGANGFTQMPYRVYEYIPASSFSSAATYQVRI